MTTRNAIDISQDARFVMGKLAELQDAIMETYAAGGLANITSEPSIASAIGPALAVDLAATAARLRLFADQVQWQYDSHQLAEPIR